MENLLIYRMYGLLLLSTGFAVAMLYRAIQTEKTDRSAYWIAATCFCGGLGLIALSTSSNTLHWVGIVLFVATPNILHVAIGSATRQSVRRTLPWMIGITISCFLATVLLNIVVPNWPIRRAPAVFSIPLMEAVNVWFLLRRRDSPTRLANMAMAVFLLLHVAVFAIRTGDIITDSFHQRWLAYAGMTVIVGLGGSFLGMESLRSRHEMERIAMTDPLTGLLNRRALEVVAHRELQRCIRLEKPCSALMMDIDRFKEINDNMGHAAGDAALRAVAGVLQSMLRPTDDVITRHGGDEFFVLLPECGEDNAEWIASQIRQGVAGCTLYAVDDTPFRIQVSVGVATSSHHEMTVQDLLHASDIVLYREKQITRSKNAAMLMKDHRPEGGGAHVHPSNA
ncbi:GGDEF domain-containing protein [Terriglobus roseus]|uniref:diguanylate cyclase n=1 Tax=Terriglobus roseus TaxID=392734 RepID=A0A1G7QV14_9BACT|nr:GGDEF domain-containing protein [Terriglobus roseus]SDG02366.1 diguanylate cyclase (GGDEF) domain-containing protein [Terriglobus roseus]